MNGFLYSYFISPKDFRCSVSARKQEAAVEMRLWAERHVMLLELGYYLGGKVWD